MQEIKIYNSNNESFDLINGAFKMLSNTTEISGTREYKTIASNNYLFNQQVNKIQPIPLTLKAKVKYNKEFNDFKRFILKEGEEFIIEISATNGDSIGEEENGVERVYISVILDKHSRLQVEATTLNNFELGFIGTTRFLKERKYIFDVTTPPIGSEPYPITYPYTYPTQNGDFDNGKIVINNKGDKSAKLRVEFKDITDTLRMSLNTTFDNTFNAFGLETTTSLDGDTIIYNGFSGLQEVSKNGVSIEQDRVIGKNTFFDIPVGTNTIFFERVEYAIIYVIEEYNDLPI